jgi:hypothetical protein
VNVLYFKPWHGERFSTTKLLILSESAYDWPDEAGKLRTPSRTHPKTSLLWSIKNFREVRYFTQMSRALCGSETPAVEERREAWNEYAYTIYVQRSVGLGARSKPTPKQFREAACHFLALIEKLRPLKVIVTGTTLWSRMPPTSVHRGDLEAYTLSDGTLVWCLAVPHPANRTVGFDWKRVGKSIHRFRSTKLPLRN